jgi:hypothetical protein
MNVRLQANEVRIRLSRGEAERLARGEAIEERLALPGGEVGWRVDPSDGPASVRLDGGTMRVTVAAAEVGALLAEKASKDAGVHATAGGVALAIEVDLWSGKKRP